jgi:hypothetical protein
MCGMQQRISGHEECLKASRLLRVSPTGGILLCGLHHQINASAQSNVTESPFALLSFSALPALFALFALKEKGRIMRSATKWVDPEDLFKR